MCSQTHALELLQVLMHIFFVCLLRGAVILDCVNRRATNREVEFFLPSPAENGNTHYRKPIHYAWRHLTFMSTKQRAARLSSVLTTPTHYPPYFKCHPSALFRKSS